MRRFVKVGRLMVSEDNPWFFIAAPMATGISAGLHRQGAPPSLAVVISRFQNQIFPKFDLLAVSEKPLLVDSGGRILSTLTT